MARDMESDALDSILGDLDKLEGKEVCGACGKPVDEDEVSPGSDKVESVGGKDELKGNPEVSGMKVTIEPMTPAQAKDKIKEALEHDDKDDEDDGLPSFL